MITVGISFPIIHECKQHREALFQGNGTAIALFSLNDTTRGLPLEGPHRLGSVGVLSYLLVPPSVPEHREMR